MKFGEAKEKLKKLAPDKYRSLDYDLTTYEDGREEATCSVYVANQGWENGRTWEEALSKMAKKLDVERKEKKLDPSEAPE